MKAHATVDQDSLRRAGEALERVRELYERGDASKAPAGGQGEGIPTGPAGSRPPLRVAVLDAVRAIEEDLNRSWPDITRAVGAGRKVDAALNGLGSRTRARFGWLALHLPDVARQDPGLCARLTAEWLRGGNMVAGALGERLNPFQTAGDCPTCGVPSLWLSPEMMVIRCEECPGEWPVEVSLEVLTQNRQDV